MQLKSILNKIEKQKGFVYDNIQWADGEEPSIRITLKPHGRSRPVCSGCGKKRSCYDRRDQREFQFIPLWGIPVFFCYVMRRVSCPNCGVLVESVPWCDGKQRSTKSFRVFLSSWARSLSWQETARRFGTSWDTVFRSIDWVVRWGLVHREFGEIEAIGVDEIAYRRGHKYLTLVYQVDAGCRRLLYVSKDRTEKSFRGFFRILPASTLSSLKFICSDMWSNYLKGPENPVEEVSWEDAMEFCRKLSALPEERAAGRAYRLPTEAEWEYACRAGTTTAYGFGDDASDLGEYAWYSSNSGNQTHPVGQKQPNAWGLYDIYGNVWEWCADWYGDYPSGSVTDPRGPQSGSSRVHRGGGWDFAAVYCRSAYRNGYRPSVRSYYRGFRVTCVPSGQ